MDGRDRITGDGTVGARRVREPISHGDTKPHFPDLIRGERCRECGGEWPCRTVKQRRWWE
ncbi:hypothetical protein GCM10023223_16070 [Stackebrandtia albiflava]